MLSGIIPIVFIPFDKSGAIDEDALRRIVTFELDGGVDGIGVNGFASEAYKLTDEERYRGAAIVAEMVDGQVPLIIGIAPGSTEAAIQQARHLSRHQPAALMTLPPNTMDCGAAQLVDYYVTLGNAAEAPVMVQQSPHIAAYGHTALSGEALAEIADRAPNVCYFKIEGDDAPARLGALRALTDPDRVRLFGGGGGISLAEELEAGASGLIPGVGYNEYFVAIWRAWQTGDRDRARALLAEIEPLVEAISGPGHEHSLHARKYLMQRAGYISHAYVRRPTDDVSHRQLAVIAAIADELALRIAPNGKPSPLEM